MEIKLSVKGQSLTTRLSSMRGNVGKKPVKLARSVSRRTAKHMRRIVGNETVGGKTPGRLKRSIRSYKTSEGAQIRTAVPYAKYADKGRGSYTASKDQPIYVRGRIVGVVKAGKRIGPQKGINFIRRGRDYGKRLLNRKMKELGKDIMSKR